MAEMKQDGNTDLCELSFNGSPCGRPRYSRGMCSAHYQQTFRGLALAPVRAKSPWLVSNRKVTCCVKWDGGACDRRCYAKGMCRLHYDQSYMGRPVGPKRAPKVRPPRKKTQAETECSAECVDGKCGRSCRSSGLCMAHYMQKSECLRRGEAVVFRKIRPPGRPPVKEIPSPRLPSTHKKGD